MLEELDIVDESFELYDNAEGEVIHMPIMEEYPNPENTFDIFSGQDGQKTSGGDAPTGGGQIDPNQIASTAGELASLLSKTELEKELKLRCGRRPLFEGKRESSGWNSCRDQFFAEMQSRYDQGRTMTPNQYEEPKKGLSTGAWIGIGLGAVALGVGIWYLAKKAKAK